MNQNKYFQDFLFRFKMEASVGEANPFRCFVDLWREGQNVTAIVGLPIIQQRDKKEFIKICKHYILV